MLRTKAKATKISNVPAEDSPWSQQLVLWRDSLKVAPFYNPFDKLEQEVIVLRMTERVRGLLNLVVAEKTQCLKRKTKKQMQTALRKTVVDISQNPGRRNYTTSLDLAHTLCTGSQLVHLGLGRMLHPKGHLWLQGHNPNVTSFPERMSLNSTRKLAGEGMALPCLAVCIWCQFLVKGYPDP